MTTQTTNQDGYITVRPKTKDHHNLRNFTDLMLENIWRAKMNEVSYSDKQLHEIERSDDEQDLY